MEREKIPKAKYLFALLLNIGDFKMINPKTIPWNIAMFSRVINKFNSIFLFKSFVPVYFQKYS